MNAPPSPPTSPLRSLAVLLLALVLMLTGTGCVPVVGGPMRVVAELEDSAGLFVGNDVGVLGVPVGEITAITPRGRLVEVEMELDPDVSVPASTGAVVVARSVATDRYVELTDAFDEKGPRLSDGDRIPLARTRTPVEFDEVLASLEELSTGLAGEDGRATGLRGVLNAGARALHGRGADANATLRELSRAAGGLAGHRQELVGTVEGLDDLTRLVAENRQVVDEFITSVTDATDLFADERNSFGRALVGLSRALRTLAAFVRNNRAALRHDLTGLTRVTDNLLRHQAALAESVEVLPLTFRNIGDAVGTDGRLGVKLPMQHLSPAREVTDRVCAGLPEVCEQLGTDPDAAELLGGLLGVVSR